jgi:hypothetical protein
MARRIAATRESISRKISKLSHEGYGQEQAIAIAFSMAGKSRKDKKKPRSGLRSSYS